MGSSDSNDTPVSVLWLSYAKLPSLALKSLPICFSQGCWWQFLLVLCRYFCEQWSENLLCASVNSGSRQECLYIWGCSVLLNSERRAMKTWSCLTKLTCFLCLEYSPTPPQISLINFTGMYTVFPLFPPLSYPQQPSYVQYTAPSQIHGLLFFNYWYTHTYKYTHPYTHTYTHTNTPTHISLHTNTYTLTHTPLHMRTHSHTHT